MLTYGDLKKQTGTKGERAILHCPACGVDDSADARDYWGMPDKEEILCPDCGLHKVLAFRRVIYKIIKR